MESSREQWLERVNRFAWEIASQLNLPRVRQVAVMRTRELCDADGATLLLYEPETGELQFELVEGAGAGALERRRLAPGEGVAGRVALERLPALVEDVRVSRDFTNACDAASGFVTQSIIAVPLLFDEQLLGVLEAVRGTQRSPFSRADLEQLTALAPHVAAAVQHLRTEASLRTAQESLQRSRDQLEKRVAERTRLIASAKQQWEATFDAMPDPVVVLDGYTVRRANRRFQQLAGGRPWGEIVGAVCYQVLAGRRTPCPGCPMKTGGRLTEVRFGEATFHASQSEVELGDGVAHVVHYRDVTEQQRLAERLRESERLASVGQLASGAAHEINNPLSFVLANLRLLRDTMGDALLPAVAALQRAQASLARGDAAQAKADLAAVRVDPSEVAEALEVIDEAMVGAQRISAVVKSLRELSRQEQGRVEPVSVAAVVQRTVSRVLGPRHGARLELETAERINAVPQQLERAIENVVKNARQASRDDAAVTVRVLKDARGVVVEVKDEGCGIPAEHLAHVFDPFFTTRRVGEGMGLGLTVTWGIVKRFGGTVEVRSEVGRGTTVALIFPCGEAQPVAVEGPEVQVGRYAERTRELGLFGVEAPAL
jgi:signal transduction histidine kinase/putative methionine-R-sulfoxide reductase with GAF domain